VTSSEGSDFGARYLTEAAHLVRYFDRVSSRQEAIYQPVLSGENRLALRS
jgi:hypothetical protein